MNSEENAALVQALRLLNSRDLTRVELQTALQKSYPQQVIETALAFLEAHRFIGDLRIATTFVERNTGRKAVGDELLKSKLKDRGVPEELIESVFQGSVTNELERVKGVMLTKFRQGATRAKAARYLWSKGFSEETIESILETIPESDPQD